MQGEDAKMVAHWSPRGVIITAFSVNDEAGSEGTPAISVQLDGVSTFKVLDIDKEFNSKYTASTSVATKEHTYPANHDVPARLWLVASPNSSRKRRLPIVSLLEKIRQAVSLVICNRSGIIFIIWGCVDKCLGGHPSEHPREGPVKGTLRRLELMFWTIVAPEILPASALNQL